MNSAANLSSLNLPKGGSGQATPPQAGVQPSASSNDLAQQLGRLQLGGLDQQVASQHDPTGATYPGQNPTAAPGGYGSGAGSRMPLQIPGQGFPGKNSHLVRIKDMQSN